MAAAQEPLDRVLAAAFRAREQGRLSAGGDDFVRCDHSSKWWGRCVMHGDPCRVPRATSRRRAASNHFGKCETRLAVGGGNESVGPATAGLDQSGAAAGAMISPPVAMNHLLVPDERIRW